MSKNKITALVIAIVLIFGGVIGWAVLQKGEIPSGEKAVLEEQVEEKEESEKEVLTITGKIVEVNAAENYLIFRESNTGEDFKVLPKKETKFICLVQPSDVKEGASFTYKKEEITISDLEVGRQAFIFSSHPIQSGEDIIGPLEVKMLP